MSIFSDIPIRANGDDVDESWWNTIRTKLIAAFPGGGKKATGTRSAATAITAAGGITSGGGDYELQFITGSGAAVTITADPQISAGTNVGDELRLVGRDSTNTVTFSDGTGLSLNGECILGADCILDLFWDGTNWVETSRDIKG